MKAATVGRPVPTREGQYRWVYLWGWPIRAMHWLAAAAIVVLAVTGFYIGKPYFLVGREGNVVIMTWMRTIHYAAAAVFVMTAIFRVYWLVAGNKYERFPALFPIRPRDWVNMFKQVKFYLMIRPEKAPHYLGHNPLQQLSYTGIYLTALIMVVTGFTLYGQYDPGGVFFRAFGWLAPLVGGMQIVRFVHHVCTWIFLAFIPIHVYLALRADVMERGGTVSSIITGGRFVPEKERFEDE